MKQVAEKLVRIVLARPGLTFALVIALGAGALVLVGTRLEFDTSFAALLPEHAPELLEVRELEQRAGGTVEMVIAVGGADKKRRLAFGRAVVQGLRGQPWIHRADVEFPVDFFERRKLLLLSVKQLGKLRDSIEEEVKHAKLRANPLYVDLEDDKPGRRPWAEVDRTEQEEGSLPDKTFTSPDGKYLFVRVKPNGMTSNMARGKVMLSRIKAAVERADPGRYGVSVRYAGGLVVNQEQHQRMTGDLKRASVIALVAILLLITLHVRRVAAPLILALPLVIGVGTTLAITALTIGKLNLITGFLVSALLGIGIDYEIHLYLRYLEQLAVAPTRVEAMRQAMLKSLPGCFTAAGTTAAAFFAMMISDFRGFREFGLIAGLGVVVTLVVTFVALPPLALALARKPRVPKPQPRYSGFSLRLAWTMVVVGGLTLIASIFWGHRVAWHNDFRQLRGISETVDFSEWVASLANGSLSPAAFMVKDLEQARRLEHYLEPLTRDPQSGVKKYISLASLVPHDVAQKLPIMHQIERRMREVQDKVKLKERDRARVQAALELAQARPWSVAAVPEVFRRLFLTVDGKAQFVVVWPRSEMYIDKEIIAWGDELNRIRADLHARGMPVKILDENRLGARVLKKMWHDAPWVIFSGSLAVVLILLIHFRSPLRVLRVAGSLAVAMGWLAGALYLAGVDFNVFNLAVIPTIIGLGIDNSVHIYHRYLDEGPGSLAHVISTTGSASFLASATTAIGFGAAVTAQHMGIRSLGWLTILGLTCAFVSSTILYPSVLRVFEGRRRPAR